MASNDHTKADLELVSREPLIAINSKVRELDFVVLVAENFQKLNKHHYG